jgi:hypothetical protein
MLIVFFYKQLHLTILIYHSILNKLVLLIIITPSLGTVLMTSDLIAIPRADMDSAWKDILEQYFPDFMDFFYPDLAKKIDWKIKYELLDKELQAITKEPMLGKQFVDKLIKVKSKQGKSLFVLIHIEVQGEKQTLFPKRLYQYQYRLFDRYNIPIITLAVLVDNNPAWRPDCYVNQLWGWEVIRMNFFTIKLLDYAKKRSLLEKTKNPFGVVTLAQLAALETRKNSDARYNLKFALTRQLYKKGLKRDAILNLYHFMDWVLTLPKNLEIRYNDAIKALEEEQSVNYITSTKRIGILEGEHALLICQLKRKFPSISQNYLKRVQEEANQKKLLAWGEQLITAKTPKDVFKD